MSIIFVLVFTRMLGWITESRSGMGISCLDEEDGYTLEYIYGNYFERVNAAKWQMMEEKKVTIVM